MKYINITLYRKYLCNYDYNHTGKKMTLNKLQ